jgi:hypothetical protein
MLIFARSVAVLSGNDSGSGAQRSANASSSKARVRRPRHTTPAHQQLGGEVRGDHVVVQLGECNSGVVAAPLRFKSRVPALPRVGAPLWILSARLGCVIRAA